MSNAATRDLALFGQLLALAESKLGLTFDSYEAFEQHLDCLPPVGGLDFDSYCAEVGALSPVEHAAPRDMALTVAPGAA